jgi:hypothetical protein
MIYKKVNFTQSNPMRRSQYMLAFWIRLCRAEMAQKQVSWSLYPQESHTSTDKKNHLLKSKAKKCLKSKTDAFHNKGTFQGRQITTVRVFKC